MSGYLDDPENRNAIAILWRKQIDLYPDDIRILKNASMQLQQTDRSLVLSLLKHCYELTKGQNREISSYYGTQLGLALFANEGDAVNIQTLAKSVFLGFRTLLF